MRYVPGQRVNYKNYSAQIVFYYPSYKKGKDAYTIKFFKDGTEFHRLCVEEELSEEMQIQFDDILK
ncbi:hypothetical protein [Pseudobacteroides cellulosolvens]|nr:hypothetical protein [Pseudobacteroides cellulosolvens]